MSSRQPYPSPPLRFVTFEVQFGLVPTLATEQGRADIFAALRDRYPIADAQMTMTMGFEFGPGGAIAPPQPQQSSELVLLNRERTRSVTVGPTAMSLQSVVYEDADEFGQAIEQALRAVESAGITMLRRVGLRFIDEIRAPGIKTQDDWMEYLSDDLTGPVRFAGDYAVEQTQGVLAMRLEDHLQVVMRYGPGVGFAVDPNGRLRLSPAEPPEFFLLDIDTFWSDPAGFRSFDVDEVLTLYSELDDPAHILFERAITDRARELFRTPKEL